jgi:heme/copper-type cytochrome/quinol oxidase subunit 3
MTRQTQALDVSTLPTFAFGQRSILWWATMGMIAIESSAFALIAVSYLYLKWRVPHWPPGFAPPDLRWGTATTIVLLATAIPNQLAKRAAERLDVHGARLWVGVCVLLALVFCVTRAMEFTTLNVWWDSNAYGSVVWTMLGLHTTHIVTDIIDTGALAAMLLVSPLDANRFVDVSENAGYYYFVMISWLPIYGLIYFAPRIV